MSRTAGFEELAQRIERADAWLAQLGESVDPATGAQLSEVVGALLEFHGAGLARVLEIVHGHAVAAEAIRKELLEDALVSGMLALHGLHPAGLSERVEEALRRVAPALAKHGGRAALVEITPEAVVRVRLEGNCHGCPSSQATLKGTIEETILSAAPEVQQVEIAADEARGAPQPAFVPLAQLAGSLRA